MGWRVLKHKKERPTTRSSEKNISHHGFKSHVWICFQTKNRKCGIPKVKVITCVSEQAIDGFNNNLKVKTPDTQIDAREIIEDIPFSAPF
jgi:hypothetical protein